MYIAKNSSKSSEDSILLAGAMMAVSRVLFYDHLSEKEAKNLSGETPILNSIATAKDTTAAKVAESVIAGKKTFDEKALALYDAMVALKQKFTNCATIRELNVLWEDYLGVPMPQQQAIELGNTEEDGWTPLPIKSGLQF